MDERNRDLSRPGSHTPLAWVNVLANPNFGRIGFRGGRGIVWGSNSQTDRLTPWFNDPISDPPGTAIYIRDDDNGWSLVATPQRSGRRRLSRASWTGLHKI